MEFCGACKNFTGAIKQKQASSLFPPYSGNLVCLCIGQSIVTNVICINLQSTCIHTWTLTLMYFSVFVDITYILGTAWTPYLLAWKVGERGKDTWIRNTSRHGPLNSSQRNNVARSERGIQYGPQKNAPTYLESYNIHIK